MVGHRRPELAHATSTAVIRGSSGEHGVGDLGGQALQQVDVAVADGGHDRVAHPP